MGGPLTYEWVLDDGALLSTSTPWIRFTEASKPPRWRAAIADARSNEIWVAYDGEDKVIYLMNNAPRLQDLVDMAKKPMPSVA